MPGIEQALVTELKAKPVSDEWLAAWTMKKKPTTLPAGKSPVPGTAKPAS
jgi:hypothetical protein